MTAEEAGLCFSNIRLLLHNNPLGALVSQQVHQTQAGLNPSKHEKKNGDFPDVFPWGGGHALEEMCHGQGHGNTFPPGNQGTLPGTSFHPAALGASAGLLKAPSFFE